MQTQNPAQMNSPAPSRYTVEVARSFEELEPLRAAWRQLNIELNADIDFFTTVARHHPNVVRPHVICLRQPDADGAGTPAAMLVGRIEDVRLKCAIGYRTLYSPAVRQYSVVYGGALGDQSPPAAQRLLDEVRAMLAAGEADVASFNHLNVDSALYQLALKTPGVFCRDRDSTPNIHWVLELPESLEALLKTRSQKARYNLKRSMKKLEETFAERLQLKRLDDIGELDAIMRDLEHVTAKTYQRGLGVGFRNTEDWRRLFELGLSKKWLTFYILDLEGRPAAYAYGYRYKDKFLYSIPGYDPQYQQYQPGMYLMLKLFAELCRDPQIKYFDYGFGDAKYKQGFSTRSWHEASVLIFAPTFKGVRVNLIRTLILKSSRRMKKLVQRFALEQKIKKIWRRQLRQSESGED